MKMDDDEFEDGGTSGPGTGKYQDDYGDGDGDDDSSLLNRKFLAGLLAVACLVVILLIIRGPAEEPDRRVSLDMVDSLISRELTHFRIPPNRIRETREMAGGVFERKSYTIQVPGSFRKTYFHMELARRLQPYGIEVFGQVEFPDRNIRLWVLYQGTVIRSIRLNTTDGYDIPGYPAPFAILITSRPEPGVTDGIRKHAAGAGVVLRAGSAEEAVQRASHFTGLPLYFWMDAADGQLPGLARAMRAASERPVFLLMDDGQFAMREEIVRAAGRNATWVDGRKAVLISDRAGQPKLEQDLSRFFMDMRDGRDGFALVEVSGSGMPWLTRILHDHRKGGMVVTRPSN